MYEEDLLVPVYVDLAPEEEVERRPRGIPPRYLKAWSQEAGERALAQDGYWEPEDLVRRMAETLQAFSHAVTEYDAVYLEVEHVPLGMGVEMGRMAMHLCAYAGMLGVDLEEMMRAVPRQAAALEKARARAAAHAERVEARAAARARETKVPARASGSARGSGAAHRVPCSAPARAAWAQPQQLRPQQLRREGCHGG